MSEQDQNRLLRGYEQMLRRLREMMDQPDELTRPHLRDALETAKARTVETHELSPEEADRIGDYLRRDLEAAATYAAKAGDQDLSGWLHMDLKLIEDWLWDQFSKVADTTKLEFLQFQQGLLPAEVYAAGEVAGPGSLRCTQCGHTLHFKRVGHIPSCPECGNTEFLRPMAEDSSAGQTGQAEE